MTNATRKQIIAETQPTIKLYDFQQQYLRGLPEKYIFAADTGTGKTFMALAHYDKLAYMKPLLILAPAAKVQTGDWDRELAEWFGGRFLPPYEVWSYEKFSRNPSVKQFREKGVIGVWREWLKKYPQGFAVIADEVHRAKNPQSGTGKRVFEVSKYADLFIGLSATPLPNGWIDAANYYKIFGFVKGITDFKQRYCKIVDYKGFPEITGYYHEEELQRYWNRIAKPLPKQSALDLPAMTYIPVTLPGTAEYLKILRERIYKDKFLDNPSALMHALRQGIVEPKVKWLAEFLEGASDNVVIFYNYISEREAILEMLKKSHKDRKVFRQDGESHELPPKPTWDSLKRTITLAQYQSGSVGVEMTYAATIVYFSPTYSYSNYEQSIGRIERHGQKSKMTLYLLCAPTTIEKEVWAALRNKSDFQEKQWYENVLALNNNRDTLENTDERN